MLEKYEREMEKDSEREREREGGRAREICERTIERDMRGERELEKYEEERDARGSAREIRERESEKDRDEKERNAEMRERERDENSAFSRNSSMPLDPIFRSARVQYTWIDATAPFDAISLDGRAVDVLRSTRHH